MWLDLNDWKCNEADKILAWFLLRRSVIGLLKGLRYYYMKLHQIPKDFSQNQELWG